MNKKREKILNLTITDSETMAAVIDGHGDPFDMDLKLTRLTVGIGQLAALLHDSGWTRSHLRRIFGFASGWLIILGGKNTTIEQVNDRISAERDRQQELAIAGRIPWNCSYYRVKPTRKLVALTEELGEVAEAVLKCEEARNTKASGAAHLHLVDELTHVAAVAVAWLEALEGPDRRQVPGSAAILKEVAV